MRNIIDGGRRACILGLATLFVACGGSDDAEVDPAPEPAANGQASDHLAAFTSQYLYWSSCSYLLLNDFYTANPEAKRLGSRIKCATMYVPRDYSNPWSGQVAVALIKISAKNPFARLGSLFFNPGGPGGDGLALPANFAALAELDDPSGQAVRPLAEHYDLIGFSPRGTGSSTQLTCWSFQTSLPYFDNGDRSPANVQAMLRNNRLVAEACLSNPLTPHINTEQTARDMDLARRLVGDSKLNYIGYSYGTWLGAWYAGLFPDRVGRMLLDSNVNFRDDLENTIRQMPVGFQRVLDARVAPYAVRHHDLFGLGATPEAVRQVFPALPIRLRGLIRDYLVRSLYRSDKVRDSLLTLVAAKGVAALLKAYPGSDLANMQVLIQGYPFAPGAAENAAALPYARSIVNSYFAGPPSPSFVQLGSQQATGVAVICNDTKGISDEQSLVEYTNRQAAQYPLDGGVGTSVSCLHWGGPRVSKPSITSVAQAGGILMLQSEFDGATPIEGATATFNALPQARMVRVRDEYTHGLFPYRTACVDQAVSDYFVSGRLPRRVLDCPAKPMAGDAVDTLSSVPAEDGAKAEQILQRIHQVIEDANHRF